MVVLRNSLQNGPNYCKSSCHEVASEFFAKNAKDKKKGKGKGKGGEGRKRGGKGGKGRGRKKRGKKRAELVKKFVQ